jgi:hypothetical protein
MTTQTPTTEHLEQIRKEFEAATASRPMLSILLYTKNEDGKYRNNNVETEWQGYLRARTEQVIEIAALKAQLAESREDYRKMVANYQTLIIDLAPYLAPDQIHMVGSRTGNWFIAMEDGKYLVRYDPRDSDAGLWENTKPTSPNY